MHYTILGTKGCKYCIFAVELLERKNKTVRYVDIKEDDKARAFFMEQKFKTVPQIYEGDRYIGGYTELKAELDGESKTQRN